LFFYKKHKMEILYEDNHIIAVNKAVSEIVQGDKTGDIPLTELVKDYIKQKYNKPGNVFIGLVHRIDRPTSGVLVLARTSKALTRLNKMFQTRDVKKIYWAIVDKRPPKHEDTINHYLKKNEKQNKSYAYNKEVAGSKLASLTYKLINSSDRFHLLEIELHTGRHHQIRAQLAHIGCKIRGDLKYGFPRSNKDGGISLHARKINFIHPIKNEPIEIIAPLPKDNLWSYFNK